MIRVRNELGCDEKGKGSKEVIGGGGYWGGVFVTSGTGRRRRGWSVICRHRRDIRHRGTAVRHRGTTYEWFGDLYLWILLDLLLWILLDLFGYNTFVRFVYTLG